MDKDTVIKYAPIAIVIIGLIFQWNLFVTPEKLEIKHREILKDVAATYTTKEQHNDLNLLLSIVVLGMHKLINLLAVLQTHNIQKGKLPIL